ncbi:hypothetical protein [Aquimarina sp. 2201CG5-10]|uniref:hypothetical protein n=1 Tax=Aquimarina callyspongiae TaxID=3098150 RepID=UPI002AB41A2D|nr:hypothetical protein [Aquimarina sp. 2201CG5-10]MDY8136247.1 hypothetical protein [Aquimarina sp. 2201CG5-10]
MTITKSLSKLYRLSLILISAFLLTNCEREENQEDVFQETTSSLSKKTFNLTGFYNGSDKGLYYIKQIGNDIFWFGEDPSGIWANTFKGTLDGNTLSGTFYDVPKGRNVAYGALTFSISSDGNVIKKTFGPGFGGNVLTKANRPSELPGTRIQGFGNNNNINDLTARWKANDGGFYYIRQIGNRIMWFGEQDYKNGRPIWSNVAFGIRSGNTINLEWIDVPKGNNGGYGKLVLKVDDANTISRTQATGGFGGRTWKR